MYGHCKCTPHMCISVRVCACGYLCAYVYARVSVIVMTLLIVSGLQHGRYHDHAREPVRFDSFRFRTFRVRFGSEIFLFGSIRFRLRFFGRVVARSGSVLFGSVRPVRFGFLFFPDIWPPARPLPQSSSCLSSPDPECGDALKGSPLF